MGSALSLSSGEAERLPSSEIVDGAPGKKHGAVVADFGLCYALDCQGGKNVKSDGTCNDACCDYFVCGICGDRFRVEWPQ